jgi:catechol 2,3-dioxygenase-like lactoylglutathione lyase family enzyme
MVSYVTVGAIDIQQSNAFCDAVLSTIGWASHVEWPSWRAWSEGGAGKGQIFWVCKPHNGEASSVGNGVMIAFAAQTKEQVHAFYDTALSLGGTDEGPPGPRPLYGPDWYSAYVRDPAGNKLAVVLQP